jgi:hypothetical protein
MPAWVLQLADLSAAIATAAALVLAYITYKGSTSAQVFMEYTRRYGEVLASFPDGELAARAAFDHHPPPPSPALTTAVLRYLNLCSEEFYMHQRGMLADRVWHIWEGEIRRKLATPLLVREWSALEDEFVTFPEFRAFVAEAQRQASRGSPPRPTP